MIYASTRPSILCIDNPREELDVLSGLLSSTLKEYEVVAADTAIDGLNKLEDLVMNNYEVAMVIAAQSLPDDEDDEDGETMQKLYEKWPHAMRMLLIGEEETPNEALIEEAKIYRVFNKPFNEKEFRNALKEAARVYEQQQELNLKSRVLNELHRGAMTLIGERKLPRLLHKLMRIVIENADALDGYIVLKSGDDSQLFIEAEGHMGEYETKIERVEVTDFSPVCPAIAEYAKNTGENVILHDAMNEGLFSTHPFIRKNQCRSILCTPLIYQGNFYGLLYLENNQKTNAFSAFNIELFRLLAAPAAIAIQNALLYGDLEAKVEKRTEEVMDQKAEIERQRDEIQRKNNDIMDSIRYAKRIQDAILPSMDEIAKSLPNSFVYFRPKDVVSGDFYWYSRRLSKVIIAAADCTGHGIPGAFMTVMANTLLKQIVELEGIFKPNEILYHLNLRIRVALQQGGKKTEDGLELALCQIDVVRNKLQYAGANRPLMLVRNKEVMEIKGDKYGIGGGDEGVDESRLYTNHTMELKPDDIIYIFSDGYPDQIGEEVNRKFLARRFFNLLLDVHQKDIHHQAMLLDAELRHWRGEKEQTDDITVIGIQF